MRSLVVAATTAALGLVLASPAMAQDHAPFTGARAEVQLGYDSIGGGDSDSDSSGGVQYGGAIGYDVQAGPVVVGGEAELSGSTTDTNARNVAEVGDRFRLNAGRDIYLGGRVGYVVSPRAMIYGKVGYTNARIDERYDATNYTFRDHQNLDGYRLGAGVEYNTSHDTYIKAEYRYSHYGRVDDGRDTYDVDVDRNQVVAGVGLRF